MTMAEGKRDNKRHAGVTTDPDVVTEGPDILIPGAITHIAVPFYAGQLDVKVRVLDERTRFGKRDLQIAPMAGRGTVWVGETRLMDPEPSYRVTAGDRDRTQAKNAAKMARLASGEDKHTGGWQQRQAEAEAQALDEETERQMRETSSEANPKLASRSVRTRRR
jgi:hypothetical protein